MKPVFKIFLFFLPLLILISGIFGKETSYPDDN